MVSLTMLGSSPLMFRLQNSDKLVLGAFFPLRDVLERVGEVSPLRESGRSSCGPRRAFIHKYGCASLRHSSE